MDGAIRLEGDIDIAGRVFAIWTQAGDDAEVSTGFEQLASDLVAARGRYEEDKAVGDTVFGRDYEVS